MDFLHCMVVLVDHENLVGSDFGDSKNQFCIVFLCVNYDMYFLMR